ncbi:MAG: retroviral-like aspartic protease family protein [Nitrospinota bacterium]|nr:retroviral-like aspartic protease family protein [Nitrospinota bacterium]
MSNQYPLSRWTKFSCALGILVIFMLVSPIPSQSKIYKWKDEKGKTHFTDSLSKIPPQYREKGKLKTMKGIPADSEDSVKLSFGEKHSNSYAIPVEPYGDNHFIVEVQLNGGIRAHLMVDTGASMIVLSERLGEILHVANDHNLPTMNFNTAGGNVESPLFILDSVRVGNAEVFGVEASTNPHFNGKVDGLLGMSFLGNFKVEIDKENLKMFLKPTADHREQLWDGHNGDWWKKKYDGYVGNIRRYNSYLKGGNRNHPEYFKIKKMVQHYSKLHGILEKRADMAGLPKEYRAYP